MAEDDVRVETARWSQGPRGGGSEGGAAPACEAAASARQDPASPATSTSPAALKAALLAEARRLGFVAAGVAAAVPLLDLQALLRLRQERGMATPWEDPDAVRRADPASLLPGARSVVAVAMAYDPPRLGPPPRSASARHRAADPEPPHGGPTLSGYVAAAGRTRSYQHVMRQRLEALGRWLEARVPGCRWAVQVDTGPLVDRAWAERAGLGWVGKNACLIVPGRGSWVFLGELVTDVALPPDQPVADACGDCDLCLRACPTDAFLGPRQLDPRRCVSFLSQKPGMLEPDERAALGQSLYGCDACQVVCPYNRQAGPGHPALRPAGPGTAEGAGMETTPALAGAAASPAPRGAAAGGAMDPRPPRAGVAIGDREAGPSHRPRESAPCGGGSDGASRPDLVALLGMGRAEFRRRYRSLTGAWRGRKTWQRNAVVALGNRGPAARAAVPALVAVLRDDPRPDLRALAAWALGRIGGEAARRALADARDREDDATVRAAIEDALRPR
ncbi:MAG TPA: tRNA epoxyqueuosine(34) reductase QueG [Thermaerobacter sp.]